MTQHTAFLRAQTCPAAIIVRLAIDGNPPGNRRQSAWQGEVIRGCEEKQDEQRWSAIAGQCRLLDLKSPVEHSERGLVIGQKGIPLTLWWHSGLLHGRAVPEPAARFHLVLVSFMSTFMAHSLSDKSPGLRSARSAFAGHIQSSAFFKSTQLRLGPGAGDLGRREWSPT